MIRPAVGWVVLHGSGLLEPIAGIANVIGRRHRLRSEVTDNPAEP
ncbi:hypothetical protein [Thalassoroseus pseudoceratinae]|nr:hypothetical protein [Thalassoroseus pseudoceratinae]